MSEEFTSKAFFLSDFFNILYLRCHAGFLFVFHLFSLVIVFYVQAVKNCVEPQRQYLSQLLRTQRLRGAEGGDSLAALLEIGASQPMDTREVKHERSRKSGAGVRTLSLLESRPVEMMGSDTDTFVQAVSNLFESFFSHLVDLTNMLLVHFGLAGACAWV